MLSWLVYRERTTKNHLGPPQIYIYVIQNYIVGVYWISNRYAYYCALRISFLKSISTNRTRIVHHSILSAFKKVLIKSFYMGNDSRFSGLNAVKLFEKCIYHIKLKKKKKTLLKWFLKFLYFATNVKKKCLNQKCSKYSKKYKGNYLYIFFFISFVDKDIK